MNQIKLGIQTASVVLGIYIYSKIWMYFINNWDKMFNDDASPGIVCFYTVWFILHIIGIIAAVIWAWM